MAESRGQHEELPRPYLRKLISDGDFEVTAEGVDCHNPLCLVLLEKASPLEHKQEERNRAKAAKSDLMMPGNRVVLFGMQPDDSRGEIDGLCLVRPTVARVGSEAVRRFHCESADQAQIRVEGIPIRAAQRAWVELGGPAGRTPMKLGRRWRRAQIMVLPRTASAPTHGY